MAVTQISCVYRGQINILHSCLSGSTETNIYNIMLYFVTNISEYNLLPDMSCPVDCNSVLNGNKTCSDWRFVTHFTLCSNVKGKKWRWLNWEAKQYKRITASSRWSYVWPTPRFKAKTFYRSRFSTQETFVPLSARDTIYVPETACSGSYIFL